jgi:fucose permease
MSETTVKANLQFSPDISFVVLIHLAFAFIGTATTLLGVILPALSGRFELDDAQSGRLFSAQFAGSLLGTFLAEILWKSLGFPLTILLGLLVMSSGICAIAFFDLNGVILGIFLNGIGIGLAIPTTNLLVSALNPHKAASALNILNFVWSGGAMICPAFVGFLGNSFDIRLPLLALSVSLLLLAFILAAFSKFRNMTVDTLRKTTLSAPKYVWGSGFALIIAAILFFCVGAENSLSGWLTAYSLRLQDSNSSLWTATATVFWMAFLLGRLFAPLFLRLITEKMFVLISLLIGLIGAALLLIPPQHSLISVGTAFAGFGLAPVFPTLFAQFTKQFGETGATKWLFVSSTIGGAFLTWLVGFLSTASGSLRSGLAVTFFCFLTMLILQAWLVARFRANTDRIDGSDASALASG